MEWVIMPLQLYYQCSCKLHQSKTFRQPRIWHFLHFDSWLSSPNNISKIILFLCVFCGFIGSYPCNSLLLSGRSVWVSSALLHRFFCCWINSFLVAGRALSWWVKWGPSLGVAGKILASLLPILSFWYFDAGCHDACITFYGFWIEHENTCVIILSQYHHFGLRNSSVS